MTQLLLIVSSCDTRHCHHIATYLIRFWNQLWKWLSSQCIVSDFRFVVIITEIVFWGFYGCQKRSRYDHLLSELLMSCQCHHFAQHTSLSFLRPTTTFPSRCSTLSLSSRLIDNDETGGDILGAGELKVADLELEPDPALSFGRILMGGPSFILRGAALARAGAMEDMRSWENYFIIHLIFLNEKITCFALSLIVEDDEGWFLLDGKCSLVFCFALKKGSVVK